MSKGSKAEPFAKLIHLRTGSMAPHSEMFELLASLKEQATLEQQHKDSGATTLAAMLPDALQFITEQCKKLIEVIEAHTVTEPQTPAGVANPCQEEHTFAGKGKWTASSADSPREESNKLRLADLEHNMDDSFDVFLHRLEQERREKEQAEKAGGATSLCTVAPLRLPATLHTCAPAENGTGHVLLLFPAHMPRTLQHRWPGLFEDV